METCLPQNMAWVRECSESRDLTQYAQEACDGEHSCDFYGSPSYAGDPCPNIVKFTVINYECEPGSIFTSRLNLTFSVAPEPLCEAQSHDDFAADLKARIDALVPVQVTDVNKANKSKAWLHNIVDLVAR